MLNDNKGQGGEQSNDPPASEYSSSHVLLNYDWPNNPVLNVRSEYDGTLL